MKRRNFIKNIGQLSAAPLVLNGIALNPFATPRMLSMLNCEGIEDRILVVLFLKGGNDGLNTLVPINQYDTYANLRPDIALAESGANGVINLDSNLSIEQQVGLHPALTSFKDLYDAGKARIIQGVGYPLPNMSHFKSTDLWLSGGDGTPENFNINSGWMGRYIESAFPGIAGNSTNDFPDPIGIQFGDSKPAISFHDHSQNYTAVNLSGQYPGDLFGLLNGIGTAPHSEMLNSEYGAELQYIMGVENSLDAYGQRITDVFNAGSNSSTNYPDNYIGYQLETIARMISGGCKTKIYMVHTYGYDTHSGQVEAGATHTGHHAIILEGLFEAIKAFNEDLTNLGQEEKVLTATFSEFGRGATQNGSLGTDHGTVAPLFLFGSGVNPGLVGNNPDLGNLDNNGNLAENFQVDYRNIYKSLLQDWLGADDVVLSNADFDNYAKEPNIMNPDVEVDPSCYIGPYVSLPVELNSFNARAIENDKVELTWETQSEINHSHFEVEKSTDGKAFDFLSSVNSRGDSNEHQKYSLLDEEPYQGVSYYRLKSIDYDGKHQYSEIRSVKLKNDIVSHYKVYPNPAVFNTQVVLTSKSNMAAEILLFGINGKQIKSIPVQVKEGFNKFPIAVDHLATGQYLIRVNAKGIQLPASKLFVGQS